MLFVLSLLHVGNQADHSCVMCSGLLCCSPELFLNVYLFFVPNSNKWGMFMLELSSFVPVLEIPNRYNTQSTFDAQFNTQSRLLQGNWLIDEKATL